MTLPQDYEFDIGSIDVDYKWSLIQDSIDFALAIKQTQTATKLALRQAGFTFGNTPFSKLWQRTSEISAAFRYPAILADDILPDESRLHRVDYLHSSTIWYIGEYTYFDEQQEVFKQERFKMESTDLLTRSEVIEMMHYIRDPVLRQRVTESPLPDTIVGEISYVGALKGFD